MPEDESALTFADRPNSLEWDVRQAAVANWLAHGGWTSAEAIAVPAILNRRREDGGRDVATAISAAALFIALMAASMPVIQLLGPAASTDAGWLAWLVGSIFLAVGGAVLSILIIGARRSHRSQEIA